MIKCNNCGSMIPDNLWKTGDKCGILSCPVCGVARAADAPVAKISLSKDDVEKAVPVEVVSNDGVVEETTISGVLDSFDNELKKAFGDTISVCPDCGKVICICSLKKLFGGDKNNVGF